MVEHAPGLPFRPPAVPASPELAWLLRRGFGPPPATSRVGSLRPELICDLAAALDLAPRVAARTPRPVLAGEAGLAASWFSAEHAAARLQTAGLRRLADLVATTAAAAAVPVCFLKGYALLAGGYTAPGERPMSDLDVLIPAAHLGRLAGSLRAAGFEQNEGASDCFKHAAPLGRGRLGTVEMHVRLPISLRGTLDTSWEELAAAGLLEPLPGAAPGMYLPARSLLVAHLLAHGLAQHRMGGYPLLRMVADLADLGDDLTDPAFRVGPYRWIAASVGWDEVTAVSGLARALTAGTVPLADPSPAGTLLRHAVALGTQAAYREHVHVEAVLRQRAGRDWWSWLVGATFLTRAQVDHIYGRPRSESGYLARRLLRPIDLLRRLAVYGTRRLLLRLRLRLR